MIGTIKPNPHLVIKDTGTPRGRGVFAQQEYWEGDVVEASPILVIRAPWEELPREIQLVVYDWGYLAWKQARSTWGVPLGFGSLINHGANPNLEYFADEARGALLYRALRHIDGGEELTVDYNADIEPGNGVDWFKDTGIKLL